MSARHVTRATTRRLRSATLIEPGSRASLLAEVRRWALALSDAIVIARELPGSAIADLIPGRRAPG